MENVALTMRSVLRHVLPVQELGLFDIQRAQQQTGQPLCEACLRRIEHLRDGQQAWRKD
jgi:hypothetical protein